MTHPLIRFPLRRAEQRPHRPSVGWRSNAIEGVAPTAVEISRSSGPDDAGRGDTVNQDLRVVVARMPSRGDAPLSICGATAAGAYASFRSVLWR